MDRELVRCLGCDRTWHSRTMAEGLRAIGACPRCGGELAWAQPATDEVAEPAPMAVSVSKGGVAPHLVLGVPRR